MLLGSDVTVAVSAAAALTGPLAWELTYTTSVTLNRKKKNLRHYCKSVEMQLTEKFFILE